MPVKAMETAKIIIGILGNIGSGKSTVAVEFAKLGCGVIDADHIVHALLAEESVRAQVILAFGSVVLTETDRIDRVKLAEEAFGNDENIEKINKILHPPVLNRCTELIEELNKRPEIKAIVLDMPLLLEVGWGEKCDKLVFVDCPKPLRDARMGEKEDIYKKNLKKREKFQIPLYKKAEIAHYTVNNNSDLTALAVQVKRIFMNIITESRF